MDKIFAFHSLNSGLYFRDKDNGLLIDMLHSGSDTGFSKFPQSLLQDMKQHTGIFSHKNDLIFTHTHSDHFDDKLVDQFHSLYQNSSIYIPNRSKLNCQEFPLSESVSLIKTASFDIYAFKSIHDGPAFEEVFHISYLIQIYNMSYIILGDALLDSNLFHLFSPYIHTPIQGIFLNPYQLNNPISQTYFRHINSKHLFLYHLPLPEDDIYNYQLLAELSLNQATKHFSNITQLPLMSDITSTVLQ